MALPAPGGVLTEYGQEAFIRGFDFKNHPAILQGETLAGPITVTVVNSTISGGAVPTIGPAGIIGTVVAFLVTMQPSQIGSSFRVVCTCGTSVAGHTVEMIGDLNCPL